MTNLYRKTTRAKDGVATPILDPLAVLNSESDWNDVTDVPLGYDDDTDALIPLKNITLDTVNVAEELEVKGLTYLDDDVVIGAGLTVRGDLVVDGSSYTTEEESLDTTSDYVVLRHNNPSGLGASEHSGLVVNNYQNGKNASIAVDNKGIWRVADNASESTTSYSNISQYNGVYYEGLEQSTSINLKHGAPTSQDADEMSEVVYYDNKYYKWDNVHWYEINLTDDKLYFDIQSPITDETLIAALNNESQADLFYYRSLSIMSIDDTTNQPLLTRDEEENLPDGTLLKWDAANHKAIAIDNQPNLNNTVLTANISPNTEEQAAHYFRLDKDIHYYIADKIYDENGNEAELPSDTPSSSNTLDIYDPFNLGDRNIYAFYIYDNKLWQTYTDNTDGSWQCVIDTSDYDTLYTQFQSEYDAIIASGSIGQSVTVNTYTESAYYNDSKSLTNLDATFKQSSINKLADITIDANNNWYDNGAVITSLDPYELGEITDPIDPITDYTLYRVDGTIQVETSGSKLEYVWKSGGSGSVSVFDTLEEAEAALSIPEGADGYIPDKGLIIVRELSDYVYGEDR